MRERLKAVAVAAASFIVVTGSIVSIGMASAEPASARMLGIDAAQKVSMAWPQAPSASALPAGAVEVASLR